MVPYFTQEIIESTIGCYVHSNVNLRCNYLEDGRKIGWLEEALYIQGRRITLIKSTISNSPTSLSFSYPS